ncbi:hypothetical protein Tco_0400835 [Tanacetum coccineum]
MVCRRTDQVRSNQPRPSVEVSRDSLTKLGYEGVSSGEAKLIQIFIKIEKDENMVDSQLVEEDVRGLEPREVGTETQKGPTEPVSQTQTTPSPSPVFIKENIDVLRIMIKEHDQQTKTKTTPRKLIYVDSEREAPAELMAKSFSDRFSIESSGTSDTRGKAQSAG